MTQVESSQPTPAPAAVSVRKASAADLPELVNVMARAFDDDPIANWFAAQDGKRQQRIHRFMRVAMHRLTFPYGEVYTTDTLQGGALWTPPGKWKMGILQQLMMTPDMVRTTTLRRLPAVIGGLGAIEKKHPPAPHYYLLALGVEPDLQGKGIGTRLMQPVLERCDTERIGAFLESSKERNVPLYERNGFEVTEEMVVPNGGPKIWLMWRDPR